MTDDEFNQLRRMAYSQKATNGDANAQYWMGFLSAVVDRTPETAIMWYGLSAKQGNIKAMKDLAFGYGDLSIQVIWTTE